jgi:hypothetical protein
LTQLWGHQAIALKGEVLRRRIYAPLAYAPVRNTAVIPVVHSECMPLASWFPLVWRRRPAGPEFVAVRALLDDQRAQVPASRAVLPMVLHGYPFVFDPCTAMGTDCAKMLDDVFADAPTDVGATITSINHKLTRATSSRFRILDRYAAEYESTAAIGAALAERDHLVDWPLAFDIDGRRITLPDLLVIRADAFESGDFASLLERFGRPCAEMLSLHRVSLFRTGTLLAMARAMLRENGTTERATSAVAAPELAV